jgi:hypothetical protein
MLRLDRDKHLSSFCRSIGNEEKAVEALVPGDMELSCQTW